MLQGAGVTLALTFWAVLGGTLMGLVFGLLRAVAPWWINGRWAPCSTSSARSRC